jgi:hypothetical protein
MQIKFIRNSSTNNNNNNKWTSFPNFRSNMITIVGIVIVIIGVAGSIRYGSEFIKS